MFDWFKSHVGKGGKILKIDSRRIGYSPKNDITAYEVSQCLTIMFHLFSYKDYLKYDYSKSFVLSYPPEVVRHFKLE